MNGKILIIAGSMPSDTPFLDYYINIMEADNKEYDVICWNRKCVKDCKLPSNYYVWDRIYQNNEHPFLKIVKLFLFSLFCKRMIRHNSYSHIIVLTIPISLFLSQYLAKKYPNNYLLDIRDHSPLLSISIFKRWFNKELANAGIVAISSNGFKKWLPDNIRYVVSHNVSQNLLQTNITCNNSHSTQPIRILTAGLMLRYDCNVRVIQDFANKNEYELAFVGEGSMGKPLLDYCTQNSIKNVKFEGRYEKQDEGKIYLDSSIVNIFLPRTLNSDTCMSNRFYNSVVYRRPMIVNEGSYQAELVSGFGLGLVLSETDNFYDKVTEYWKSIDWTMYNHNCASFLEMVKNENDIFIENVKAFLKNENN